MNLFTPLESPSIYAGDGGNRKHQLLIEGGVKALPFQTGFAQGGQKMRTFKRIWILAFIVVLLMLEANHLFAQEKFSILIGKVVGIRARMWLDVESEKDQVIVNFRIGHKTVYVPHRYPYPGERVKVEYLVSRGTPVAYTVNILEGSK
jgi:hypothetical protein